MSIYDVADELADLIVQERCREAYDLLRDNLGSLPLPLFDQRRRMLDARNIPLGPRDVARSDAEHDRVLAGMTAKPNPSTIFRRPS